MIVGNVIFSAPINIKTHAELIRAKTSSASNKERFETRMHGDLLTVYLLSIYYTFPFPPFFCRHECNLFAQLQ